MRFAINLIRRPIGLIRTHRAPKPGSPLHRPGVTIRNRIDCRCTSPSATVWKPQPSDAHPRREPPFSRSPRSALRRAHPRQLRAAGGDDADRDAPDADRAGAGRDRAAAPRRPHAAARLLPRRVRRRGRRQRGRLCRLYALPCRLVGDDGRVQDQRRCPGPGRETDRHRPRRALRADADGLRTLGRRGDDGRRAPPLHAAVADPDPP